ncbi:DoxX family protein [Neobacillus sp. OS1-32]|uniref:DoxX family protein n=1 Tax=Neobacillus paridis TaxID=2803862 RepID=A0ABS1TJK1_9BACI|nr:MULTISPECIES: DoxX family protein [Neobacillus]MBL4951502.1 DoxX family protein [Neobacillus paridis]WML28780.1 DoxX family protein [Neobacillus sp. OS1-32]
MFSKWLRENKVAAGILTVLRLYLGYTFFTAGLHKLTGGFDASGFLKGAIAHPVTGPTGATEYGWYVSFLKGFALPNVDIFNVVVPTGEVLIGLGLILGCLTTAAVFFALVMNFSFMFAGTVSSNPLDILLGTIILTAGYNAGHFGLDRWVIPFIRRTAFKGNNAIKQNG